MTIRSKRRLIIAAVFALVLVGGTLWLYHSIGALARKAVLTYGPEILGVTVDLAGVDLQPLEGAVVMRGLVLGNPKGFHTDQALSVGEIRMRFRLRSFLEPVIVIERIQMNEADIAYEMSTRGTNLDAIQRNVDTYTAAQSGGKPSGEEKKLVIQELVVQGAKVRITARIFQGKALSVSVQDIRLRDIGAKSSGATAGEVVREVLGALIHGVVTAVAGA